MKILVTNEAAGLIAYRAYNWQYKNVYVVCYGLQVEQFDGVAGPVRALRHFNACIRHSNRCNGGKVATLKAWPV